MKLFFLVACLLLLNASARVDLHTQIVCFSKSVPLESSSTHCGNLKTGLIYSFRVVNIRSKDSLIYGLIVCPDLLDPKLFVYDKQLKIKYSSINSKDLSEIFILNKHKYQGLKLVLITDIRGNNK
jgi:hypothetical protein